MTKKNISLRSRYGILAANFFLAEMVGVILPFLAVFLKQHNWTYDKIGLAIALGGVGIFCFQIFAGVISDRSKNQRLLLASTSVLLGVCYAIVPFAVNHSITIYLCILISGAVSTFFSPLLSSLALSLAGRKDLDRFMGVNQCWNHIGNITAALLVLWVVNMLGISPIFYVFFLVSLLAAICVFTISTKELVGTNADQKSSTDVSLTTFYKQIVDLLKNDTVKNLVFSVTLFHFANASITPMVSLYLKHLGEGNHQIAWIICLAQIVMVPVSLLAGFYCQQKGRKWVFTIAFIALPIRIFLYTLTTNPHLILAIQIFEGISSGIYGVVMSLICSDLTKGKNGFNTLLAVMQTALAFGAMVGPLTQGYLTHYFGFNTTFIIFAFIALIGAVLFILKVPETSDNIEPYRMGEADMGT